MLSRVLRGGWAVLFCLCWCGCPRPAENQTDEQRNRHYVAARENLAALDYKGAIESFERAVEDNPRSALAHFELGVLYETRENDFAAALYHYNKALKLRPNAYPADNIKQRIPGCKQELVKADALGTMQPAALREAERLRDENQMLRKQILALQAQLASRPAGSTNPPGAAGGGASVPASRRPPGQANPPAPAVFAHSGPRDADATESPGGPGAARAAGGRMSGAGSLSAGDRPGGAASGSAARPRSHPVKPGETPSSIARLYGVRLEALLAANPGLEPRKLKVGQPLSVPGP
ncbi:MAG TPA: LysM peptidoglycan-binding domain-containing protein [Verrucomicrobiae bacterium]|nr:LysM peptidoglycan-binding domain-containing protein [Verrucomicrobiae bacterium]